MTIVLAGKYRQLTPGCTTTPRDHLVWEFANLIEMEQTFDKPTDYQDHSWVCTTDNGLKSVQQEQIKQPSTHKLELLKSQE